MLISHEFVLPVEKSADLLVHCSVTKKMYRYMYKDNCVLLLAKTGKNNKQNCRIHILWMYVSVSSGSDVVDWLFHHVEGFSDRREARKYASNLLKAGYIRHTVNKITFSEQCYYVFGDLCGSKCTLQPSFCWDLPGVWAVQLTIYTVCWLGCISCHLFWMHCCKGGQIHNRSGWLLQ